MTSSGLKSVKVDSSNVPGDRSALLLSLSICSFKVKAQTVSFKNISCVFVRMTLQLLHFLLRLLLPGCVKSSREII